MYSQQRPAEVFEPNPRRTDAPRPTRKPRTRWRELVNPLSIIARTHTPDSRGGFRCPRCLHRSSDLREPSRRCCCSVDVVVVVADVVLSIVSSLVKS